MNTVQALESVKAHHKLGGKFENITSVSEKWAKLSDLSKTKYDMPTYLLNIQGNGSSNNINSSFSSGISSNISRNKSVISIFNNRFGTIKS